MNAAGAGRDAVAEAAIDWMLRLGPMADVADAPPAFAAWLAADRRHAAAWMRLQAATAPFAQVRRLATRSPEGARAARETLLRPRRRVLRGLAGLCVLGAGGGFVADRASPWRGWTADLQTATAQRRSWTLDDGSVLTLDARSAVNLDGGGRRLHLRQGCLLLQAVPGNPPSWRVAGGHARLDVGAGRCLLLRADGHDRVALFEGDAVLDAAGARIALRPGDAFDADARGTHRLAHGAAGMADWIDGRLAVLDAPLAEVVDRLRSYRHGLLRLAPDAAALRVQGVFPLDDSGRALAALAETLPLQVRRFGPVTVIERGH
ncbi:FecR domain-containing protein [Luteimonas sp. XNQY3]|nr:FecR domain-containing protein [Luteimonas sp. XNQY3]MCD9006773.1 FecR domain-containing protein [Luteimonas sp. XNQY3]